MIKQPQFIAGGSHKDERGTVSFINDFKMDEVKRLYFIEHPDINMVRAWQGHKKEQKWFYVSSGSFKVIAIKPNDWENPSNYLDLKQFVLAAGSPGILYIPGGYANGFKALEPHSIITVFSDFTVEQSAQDNYRFDPDLWFNWET